MKRIRLTQWLLAGLILILAACSQTPPKTPDATDEPTQSAQGVSTEIRQAMTWRVLEQTSSYVHVGADSLTNAYQGDTNTDSYLPVLCLYQDGRAAPGDLVFDYNSGWSKGEVALTPKVPGILLTSLEEANALCESTFGANWRIAEFHDSYYGDFSSLQGGWSFWAQGSLPSDTRFWVSINDQPANPWNGTPTGIFTNAFSGSVAAENTQVLDAAMANALSSFNPETGTVVFDQSVDMANLQIGDVLVSGITNNVPAGVPPRKISAVRQEAGQVIVETAESSLEDILLEGEIDQTQPLSETDISELIPGDGVTILDDSQGDFQALSVDCTKNGTGGIKIPFEKVIDSNSNGQALLRGCLRFKPDVQFKFKTKWSKVQHFKLYLGFEDEAELEFEANYQLSFAKEWEIARVNFNSITFSIGPVPVVITPYVALVVGIDGNISARFNYKVSQDARVGIGTEYIRGSGWRDLSQSDFNFTAPEPGFDNVNLSATVKAYAGIKPGIKLWTTVVIATAEGDLYGVIRAYGKGTVQIPGTPIWRLSAGVQFCWGYGVKLKVLWFNALDKQGQSCGDEKELWSKEGGSSGNARPAMTWRVLEQSGSYVHVGRDGITNAYSGDTSTVNTLPVLCLYQDGRSAPGGITFDFYNGWSKGALAATQPVVGTSLTSLEAANQICVNTFGTGWRMAEFHDGYYGTDFSSSGGWSYWGEGSLPTDTRFWVYINDQNANPWN